MQFRSSTTDEGPCASAALQPASLNDRANDSSKLMLLLLRMPSLLSHQHDGSVRATAGAEGRGGERGTQHHCEICRFLILLCHWAAARVAIPERCWVEWKAKQQVHRERASTLLAASERCESGGCGEADSESHGGNHFYKPSTAVADGTVACLLPAYTQEDHLQDSKSIKHYQSSSSGASAQSILMRDAELQRNVDSVFQSLENGERGNDNGFEAGELTRRNTNNLAGIHQLYVKLKRNDAYLFRPATLPQEQIALLFEVFAASNSELAALAILRVVTPSAFSLPSSARLHSVSYAFQRLLDAQQAARSAVVHFDSSACDSLLNTRIRPLMDALTLDSAATCGCSALHSQVELTADPSKSISGRGLVATGAIQEGELIIQEISLLTVPDSVYTDGAQTSSTKQAEHLSDVLERALPNIGINTHDVHAGAAAEHVSCLDGLRAYSAADYVVDLFARHSVGFGDTWWFRWALTLPEALLCDSTFAGTSSHGSMRTCIKEAVLAACTGTVRETAKDQLSPEATTVSPSTPQCLRLLALREADELHLPRPLFDGASQFSFQDRLLPVPNNHVRYALFCLMQFVNHACTSNAMLVYDTRDGESSCVAASLIALRDIGEGEEITISYVPATTSLTVSQSELAGVLGFACRCALCTQKAALLHGVLCGECKQLVWAPPGVGNVRAQLLVSGVSETGEEGACGGVPMSAFCHAAQCSQIARTLTVLNNNGVASKKAESSPNSVVSELRHQLDCISVRVETMSEAFYREGGETEDGGCSCHDTSGGITPSYTASADSKRATSVLRLDPLVAAVRQLVDLDDCVAQVLLPTHHLRLRIRLEAFAYASVARGLGSTLSTRLMQLCASTIADLEVLLGVNQPLLTGLRMHLVFGRGRHARAVEAAEAVAHGKRHADCCGAVREQSALMALPFVLDPLLRRCVTRCFQEHYVQLVGWRLAALGEVTEGEVLWSFLRRYPVELDAAGITTPEHMELLACMEDNNSNAM